MSIARLLARWMLTYFSFSTLFSPIFQPARPSGYQVSHIPKGNLYTPPTDHDLGNIYISIYRGDHTDRIDHLDHLDNLDHLDHIKHINHIHHIDHIDDIDRIDHVDRINHIDNIDHIDHIDHIGPVSVGMVCCAESASHRSKPGNTC